MSVCLTVSYRYPVFLPPDFNSIRNFSLGLRLHYFPSFWVFVLDCISSHSRSFTISITPALKEQPPQGNTHSQYGHPKIPHLRPRWSRSCAEGCKGKSTPFTTHRGIRIHLLTLYPETHQPLPDTRERRHPTARRSQPSRAGVPSLFTKHVILQSSLTNSIHLVCLVYLICLI